MPRRSPRCEEWDTALKKNKLGIRSRIMLYLVLFVAFVIGTMWLFQIVWLDDFYRYYKTNQVASAAKAVLDNIDNEEVEVLADQLASQNDVCILVLDSKYRPVISSEDTQFCLIHRMDVRDLSWWCERIPKDGSTLVEQFNVQPFQNDRYNARRFVGSVPPMAETNHQSLLYAQRITLPDETSGYILLNTIITPLDATVTTLRSQLLLITTVVLVGALLLALLISRNVSRPIIETNEAARELSHGRYVQPRHGGNYREMAELNATLARAADDLNQVERLQHELIANISHDLRTPLTMIGGYAEVMRDIPGENTPENMQIVIDETARLSSLVGEVLDFSRLQSGALPMNVAPFDLTGTVQEIIGRIGKLVESDGYTVCFEPETHLTVHADEARINQVVYNLVGNALTYTGEDKRVEVTQEVRDGRVRIAIRDTGKGIPENELPLIWNRYYRTGETHRRAIIGSGLGLSIVQSILEQHHAPYGVESQLGEGSVFWFELPIDE